LVALNVGFVSFVQASILQGGPPQVSGRKTPADGIRAGRIPELDGGIARSSSKEPVGKTRQGDHAAGHQPLCSESVVDGKQAVAGIEFGGAEA